MKRFAPLAAVALLALTACVSGSNEPEAPSPSINYQDGMSATVVSVETGNTFTAEIEGVQKPVRLINTAAPSTHGVALSNTCLVEESTSKLAEKLPEGTEVTLNFDESQRGGTGYVEAAVYAGETFINVDMARSGLVSTTFATADDEFYSPISEAQQDAAAEGLGLYSKSTDCTIPGNIEQQVEAIEDARTWEVPEDDVTRTAERETVYREASELYNSLEGEAPSPSNWVGSIVTLDAVQEQMADLRSLLGDDYYPRRGDSVNQQKKATTEATPVRPGS